MKIACLQMNSGNDLAANLASLAALVEQAVSQGAQLVASPENTFGMYAPEEGRPSYTMESHPGIAAAARLARECGCWLLIGSAAVQSPEPGKSYNRSLLFAPDGTLAAHYDKIHLFDVALPGGETYAESARFAPGNKAVVAQLPGAKLGLTVCYDVRFPHLYRALARAGAEVLAVPSAFTATTGEAHWHVLLRARAIETGCFVIAPAQVGVHPGNRKTYGHALIVDPWGRVLAEAGTEPGVILADIDVGDVEKVRRRLPSLSHDREFTL